jgi:adenylylsulfate kinase
MRPGVIWFTGLPASGKSSLALAVANACSDIPLCVLDGDDLRRAEHADLGYDPEHRHEQVRRVGQRARQEVDAGKLVLVAVIAPYADDRAWVRHHLGSESFFLVHCAASLAICEKRDPKGLYRQARTGRIKNVTGIDAPYEAPVDPDCRIDTGVLTIAECTTAVLRAYSP